MTNNMNQMIVDMCFDMATSNSLPLASPQKGELSWNRRRGPNDSELDPHKSIAQQFTLLRVVDNKVYSAFFKLNWQRYMLMITRQDNADGKG